MLEMWSPNFHGPVIFHCATDQQVCYQNNQKESQLFCCITCGTYGIEKEREKFASGYWNPYGESMHSAACNSLFKTFLWDGRDEAKVII